MRRHHGHGRPPLVKDLRPADFRESGSKMLDHDVGHDRSWRAGRPAVPIPPRDRLLRRPIATIGTVTRLFYCASHPARGGPTFIVDCREYRPTRAATDFVSPVRAGYQRGNSTPSRESRQRMPMIVSATIWLPSGPACPRTWRRAGCPRRERPFGSDHRTSSVPQRWNTPHRR